MGLVFLVSRSLRSRVGGCRWEVGGGVFLRPLHPPPSPPPPSPPPATSLTSSCYLPHLLHLPHLLLPPPFLIFNLCSLFLPHFCTFRLQITSLFSFHLVPDRHHIIFLQYVSVGLTLLALKPAVANSFCFFGFLVSCHRLKFQI